MKDIEKFGMPHNINIKIFSKDKEVKLQNGSIGTIEYVHIRGYKLFVKLKENVELIPEELIVVDSTTLEIIRT